MLAQEKKTPPTSKEPEAQVPFLDASVASSTASKPAPKPETIWRQVMIVLSTPAIVFGAFGQASEALVVSAGAAFFPKALEVQVRLSLLSRGRTACVFFTLCCGAVQPFCVDCFHASWCSRCIMCQRWNACRRLLDEAITCPARRSATLLLAGLACWPVVVSDITVPGGRQVARWTWRIAFFAFLTTVVFFMGCDMAPLAGVTTTYDGSSGTVSLEDQCNAFAVTRSSNPSACRHVYTPVCSAGGVTFVNPCYGGCYGATGSTTALDV